MISQLCLCEQRHLILKPGNYRFMVDPSCNECVKIAMNYGEILNNCEKICLDCVSDWGGEVESLTILPDHCDMCNTYKAVADIDEVDFRYLESEVCCE